MTCADAKPDMTFSTDPEPEPELVSGHLWFSSEPWQSIRGCGWLPAGVDCETWTMRTQRSPRVLGAFHVD
jgi:hypothetical protein